MTLYHEMTKAQAQAALQEFLEEREPALQRLRQRMAEDGLDTEEVLDNSLDSLVAVWRWAKTKLRTRDRNDATETTRFAEWTPSWLRHTIPDEPTLSYDTVLLLDGVISWYCRIIERSAPRAEWRVGYDRIKAYDLQNFPVLGYAKEEFGLGNHIDGDARAHLKGIRASADDELAVGAAALIKALGGTTENKRRPLVEEPLFWVEDLREDELDDYDFEVSVSDEIANVYSEFVDRMVNALGNEPGVAQAFREDRERLLVTAPDWTAPRLEDWLTTYLGKHLGG